MCSFPQLVHSRLSVWALSLFRWFWLQFPHLTLTRYILQSVQTSDSCFILRLEQFLSARTFLDDRSALTGRVFLPQWVCYRCPVLRKQFPRYSTFYPLSFWICVPWNLVSKGSSSTQVIGQNLILRMTFQLVWSTESVSYHGSKGNFLLFLIPQILGSGSQGH